MSEVIATDPYTILEGQKKYYKNLYSSKTVNLRLSRKQFFL